MALASARRYAPAADALLDAARQRHVHAMWNLAELCPVGDLLLAAAWARKAARLGHPRVVVTTAISFLTVKGERIDPAEAMRWYLKGGQTRAPDRYVRHRGDVSRAEEFPVTRQSTAMGALMTRSSLWDAMRRLLAMPGDLAAPEEGDSAYEEQENFVARALLAIAY